MVENLEMIISMVIVFVGFVAIFVMIYVNGHQRVKHQKKVARGDYWINDEALVKSMYERGLIKLE